MEPKAKTDSHTVQISTAALDICGLDDRARFVDIERRRANHVSTTCTGTLDALRSLASELHDRATEGPEGYNHTAKEKATLRRALVALRTRYGITTGGW